MPSRNELLVLATLFLQAIAHPAPAVPESLNDLDQDGNLEVLFSQAFAYHPSKAAQQSSVQYGGDPDSHCGGGGHEGGGHGGGGGGGSGYPGPTVTVTSDWYGLTSSKSTLSIAN